MRVLHVVPSVEADRGGPSRSVLELVAALLQRGVDARVAARGSADVSLRHLHLPGEIPDRASRRALAGAIGEADLIEIHSLWNGTVSVAAAIARRMHVPYIITPRGMLDPACLRNGALRKRIYGVAVDRKVVTHAAGFHYLSDDERDRAVLPRRAASLPHTVAPNGVTAPPRLGGGLLRRLVPQIGARRVLLHLGRLDPIKGINLQLQAIALMEPASRPVLVLIGPDFGAGAALRREAVRLGIADCVIFGAPQFGQERYELLADADLVVLTSIYDCNPVAITEALSVGAPVVATEGCGLSGAARAGAVIVVPRTAEAFAHAVQDMLADEHRRAAMRQRALEYAGTQSWEAVLEPLLTLYDRVLTTRAAVSV